MERLLNNLEIACGILFTAIAISLVVGMVIAL